MPISVGIWWRSKHPRSAVELTRAKAGHVLREWQTTFTVGPLTGLLAGWSYSTPRLRREHAADGCRFHPFNAGGRHFLLPALRPSRGLATMSKSTTAAEHSAEKIPIPHAKSYTVAELCSG